MSDQCRYRIEAKERELSLRYEHRELKTRIEKCKMPEPICEKELEIARLARKERKAILKKMLNEKIDSMNNLFLHR